MTYSGNRVRPDQIATQLRADGLYALGATDIARIGRENDLGRYLRSPHLGWVFTAEQAEQVEDIARKMTNGGER